MSQQRDTKNTRSTCKTEARLRSSLRLRWAKGEPFHAKASGCNNVHIIIRTAYLDVFVRKKTAGRTIRPVVLRGARRITQGRAAKATRAAADKPTHRMSEPTPDDE